jgi:hypothetical protein
MRILTTILILFISFPAEAGLQRLVLKDSLKISDVWSGHPVDFSFVTRGDSQYIACFDSLRRMTVAIRDARMGNLRIKNLPSTLSWDSHNYISMALDSAGYIHVSGNMHSSALVYFRSSAPYAIDSLKSAAMVGSEESSVTYPVFYYGPTGELVYMYRTGSSGNGDQIFNKWTIAAKKWSRLFDNPLFDGQGQRNAYMGGPVSGPDGYYYVYWMWRETADAATTHDVGCIRSKDLINWENAAGKKLTLPITASTQGVLVETIAQHGGVINRGAVGFDALKRPIVTYHKFDAKGNTQLYNARWEDNAWKIHQVTDWTYRWDFGGTGTLVLQITFGPVELEPSGALTQSYYHAKNGAGIMLLNDTTLHQKSDLGTSLWPAELEKVKRQGMVVHWLKSSGVISLCGSFFNSTSTPPKDPSIVYALRWETMPENQDQPRSPIPPPTPLMLYTFKDPNVATSIEARVAKNRPAQKPCLISAATKNIIIGLPDSWHSTAICASVVDCTGKEAAKFNGIRVNSDQSTKLTSTALPSGYYVVTVRSGALTWSGRVVLVH